MHQVFYANHTYGKTFFKEHCVMVEDLSAIKYFSTYALAILISE